MGGQVLGGGVIVLVAVVLWLVYLLPSWYSRHQYTSAERNAVRLNQALRVLAETSETPGEVRLELNARTALQQQKLARRAQAEQEQADLAVAKARLEVAKREAALERDAARAEKAAALEMARAERAAAADAARAERLTAVERVRAEKVAAVERARIERATARAALPVRRARARRRLRLAATVGAFAGAGVATLGAWQVATGGVATLAWIGGAALIAGVVVLHRMNRVAGRTRAEVVADVTTRTAVVQDVPLATASTGWTPRELPRPLASSSGSRAAAVLDEQAAREALQVASRDEAARERARAVAPPSIDTARVARGATGAAYSRMGYVDDAEIEAHVRDLLARRAVGA
jgi:hypothetical protein